MKYALPSELLVLTRLSDLLTSFQCQGDLQAVRPVAWLGSLLNTTMNGRRHLHMHNTRHDGSGRCNDWKRGVLTG